MPGVPLGAGLPIPQSHAAAGLSVALPEKCMPQTDQFRWGALTIMGLKPGRIRSWNSSH
jgi:hypothetical protein